MWNRHELCECWSPQYGMILRLPVEYFELEDKLCEVVSVAEDDFHLDDSEGCGGFSWYYPV